MKLLDIWRRVELDALQRQSFTFWGPMRKVYVLLKWKAKLLTWIWRRHARTMHSLFQEKNKSCFSNHMISSETAAQNITATLTCLSMRKYSFTLWKSRMKSFTSGKIFKKKKKTFEKPFIWVLIRVGKMFLRFGQSSRFFRGLKKLRVVFLRRAKVPGTFLTCPFK